jgi:23S rRNA (uridine2479-2'-O)-methyltransferase
MAPHTLAVTAENQWFQLVQALKTSRQKRHRKGLFFVEGVRAINQLRARRQWEVEALLYAAGRRLSGWARDILAEVQAAVHLELSPRLMDAVSDREEGSEIIAIVKMRRMTPADIPLASDACIVLLDRPGNPGNLGSIIRSCDAFGVTGIVVTGHSVDPFDPQVIRASAGAFFSQTLVRIDEQAALDEWLRALEASLPGLRVVGTSAKAVESVSACMLTGPVVLCFGNETLGLSLWLKARCTVLAGMPMQGVASSLNLACAVTAVLYEMSRQRAAFS